MHRVECESCKASYQVDERRIPPNGLKMRCPKCGHTFIVKLEGGAAIVLPIKPGAAPPAAAGSSLPRPTAPSVPDSAPPKSRPSKSPEADDPFADLPSPTKSAPADLPAAKRIAAPTRPERPPPNLAKAAAAIAAKPAAPPLTKQGPPRPAITPSLDDLPAVGEKFGAKFGKPSIPTAPKPAPPKSAPDLGDLDIDLPVAAKKPVLPPTVPAKGPPQKIPPRPPPPMPTPSLELEMNLPIAVGRPDLLAIPARAQPAPPVPKAAPQAKPAPPAPVPPRAAFTSESDIAFGEIDLPAIGADLPALSDAGLPEVASALPSVAASLPSVAASLPQVAHSLPAVASALPANLDSLPAQAESLPMTLDALPVHAESLPIRSSAPPAEVIGQDDLGDFGELDLPPGPLSGPPLNASLPPARVSKAPEMEVGRAGDFGDLFGPSDPTSPTVAKEAEFSDAFGDALASVTNDPSMPPPAQKAKPGAEWASAG